MNLLLACVLVKVSVVVALIKHGVNSRNSLIRIKPVGVPIARKFLPLTEIPPPLLPPTLKSIRRHLEEDAACSDKTPPREVYPGKKVNVFGDYYEDRFYMTVATIIFPDHIDHKHFEVTTQVPYFTVGTIPPMGFHPTTHRGDHPPECEKIYQDHLDEMYSEESVDQSEESLEMARMPVEIGEEEAVIDDANMYSDMNK